MRSSTNNFITVSITGTVTVAVAVVCSDSIANCEKERYYYYYDVYQPTRSSTDPPVFPRNRQSSYYLLPDSTIYLSIYIYPS
mmetsp:Transcript_66046/g.73956  ORF Transcript_66046/g.73956 Transcript_66046/m.73956 type:complete len:82 (+) Transcript_66046:681-926(+)